MTDSAEGELFVVVSIANNGVVHVWGDNESKPFTKRSKAANAAAKMRRALDYYAARRPDRDISCQYSVCKVLGKPPNEEGKK
jgi:hypothetical protein